MKLWLILAGISIGCGRPAHEPVRDEPKEPTQSAAEREPAFQAAVADANRQILARQKAVKAWASVAIPAADAPSCARAPKVDLRVDGFQTGSEQAKKTMTMLSADEIAGRPDPSLPPEIAADLAKIDQAGRGVAAPLGWATIDYTTDEFPFAPGPRAVAFQYGIAKLRLDGYNATELEQAKAELTRDELILVIEGRKRSEVNGGTFDPGSMHGVALLWSYHDAAFVCAGQFGAANESTEFRGVASQVDRMPEEEVVVRAFGNAATNLRQL